MTPSQSPGRMMLANSKAALGARGRLEGPTFRELIQGCESVVKPKVDWRVAGFRLDYPMDIVDRRCAEVSQIAPCFFIPHERFAAFLLDLSLVRLQERRERRPLVLRIWDTIHIFRARGALFALSRITAGLNRCK